MIATSTTVDIKAVKADAFDDAYFAKAKVPRSQKKKKKEDDVFAADAEKEELSAEKKAAQATVDKAIKCDANQTAYLKDRFSLSKRDAPHAMVF